MRIDVEFTGLLRAAAGAPVHRMDVPEGTPLPKLLTRLAEQLGPSFHSALLSPEGNLAPGIIVCIGNDQITDLAAVNLRPGDELLLLSAISGG